MLIRSGGRRQPRGTPFAHSFVGTEAGATSLQTEVSYESSTYCDGRNHVGGLRRGAAVAGGGGGAVVRVRQQAGGGPGRGDVPGRGASAGRGDRSAGGSCAAGVMGAWDPGLRGCAALWLGVPPACRKQLGVGALTPHPNRLPQGERGAERLRGRMALSFIPSGAGCWRCGRRSRRS